MQRWLQQSIYYLLGVLLLSFAGTTARAADIPSGLDDDEVKGLIENLAISLTYSIGCSHYDQTVTHVDSVLRGMAQKGYFVKGEKDANRVNLESLFNSYYARWCGFNFEGFSTSARARHHLSSPEVQQHCYDSVMQFGMPLREYLHQINYFDPNETEHSELDESLKRVRGLEKYLASKVKENGSDALKKQLNNGQVACLNDKATQAGREAVWSTEKVNAALEPFSLSLSDEYVKIEHEEIAQPEEKPAPASDDSEEESAKTETMVPISDEGVQEDAGHAETGEDADKIDPGEEVMIGLGGFMDNENAFLAGARGWTDPGGNYHEYVDEKERTEKQVEWLRWELSQLLSDMEGGTTEERLKFNAWRVGAFMAQTLRWNEIYPRTKDIPSNAPDYALSLEEIIDSETAEVCKDSVPKLKFMQERCQDRLRKVLMDFAKPFWITANDELRELHGSLKEERSSDKMIKMLLQKYEQDDNPYQNAVSKLSKDRDTLVLFGKIAAVMDPKQFLSIDDETLEIMGHYSTLAPPLDWVTWHVKGTQLLDEGKTELEDVVIHRDSLYERRRITNEYLYRTHRSLACGYADDSFWFNGAKLFLLRGENGYNDDQFIKKIVDEDPKLGDLMEACIKKLSADGKDPKECYRRLKEPVLTLAKAFGGELYESFEEKPKDIGRMVEVLDAARAYVMNRGQVKNFDTYVAALESFAILDRMADALDEIRKVSHELGLECGLSEEGVYKVNPKLSMDSDLGTMYFNTTGARVSHQLVNGKSLNIECPSEFKKKKLCIHNSRDVVVIDPGQSDSAVKGVDDATRNSVSPHIHEGHMAYVTSIFLREFLLTCGGKYDPSTGQGLDPSKTFLTRHAAEERYGQFSMKSGHNGTIKAAGGAALGTHIDHLIKGKKNPLIVSIHFNAGNGKNVEQDRPEAFFPSQHRDKGSHSLARHLFDGVVQYTNKYYQKWKPWAQKTANNIWVGSKMGKDKYVTSHRRQSSIRPLWAKSGGHQTLFECMFMDGSQVKDDLKRKLASKSAPYIDARVRTSAQNRKVVHTLNNGVKVNGYRVAQELVDCAKGLAVGLLDFYECED